MFLVQDNSGGIFGCAAICWSTWTGGMFVNTDEMLVPWQRRFLVCYFCAELRHLWYVGAVVRIVLCWSHGHFSHLLVP